TDSLGASRSDNKNFVSEVVKGAHSQSTFLASSVAYGKAFASDACQDRRKIRVPVQGKPFSLMRMWASRPCGLRRWKTFPHGTSRFEDLRLDLKWISVEKVPRGPNERALKGLQLKLRQYLKDSKDLLDEFPYE
ncbi:hypothetical protein HAX54_051747, partial [Datura stramonium]|nr:hypothetical protein [Datura stramonium]